MGTRRLVFHSAILAVYATLAPWMDILDFAFPPPCGSYLGVYLAFFPSCLLYHAFFLGSFSSNPSLGFLGVRCHVIWHGTGRGFFSTLVCYMDGLDLGSWDLGVLDIGYPTTHVKRRGVAPMRRNVMIPPPLLQARSSQVRSG